MPANDGRWTINGSTEYRSSGLYLPGKTLSQNRGSASSNIHCPWGISIAVDISVDIDMYTAARGSEAKFRLKLSDADLYKQCDTGTRVTKSYTLSGTGTLSGDSHTLQVACENTVIGPYVLVKKITMLYK